MSWQATAWAAGQSCGGPGGKCLLYAIANYAGEAGDCYVGDERLADDTEMTARSIQNWKRKFVEMGLVTIRPRGHRKGRVAFDVISLNMADESAERPENISGGQSGTTGNGFRSSTANDRKLTTERPENDDIAYKEEPKGTDNPPNPPEGAFADSGLEGERDTTGNAPSPPPATFEDFQAAYRQPEAKWDRAKPAWNRLSPALRRRAIEAVPGYRRQYAATGRRLKAPAGFLAHPETWDQFITTDSVALANWSRGWSAALHGRLAAGMPIGAMWHLACRNGGGSWSVKAAAAPGENDLAALVKVPHDSAGGLAWAAWFRDCHGLGLPEFRERQWLWMPSAWPPGSEGAAVGGEVVAHG